MKSFGKTFRAILALSLALCMVMSCVTVSADETLVSLTVGTPASTPVDGYYTVTATVGELAPGNSATILVHKELAPDNNTIGYVNQDVIADGQTSKTFTMELKKGTYTVLAGGTGKTAAKKTTLTINGVAPAFASGATLEVIALNDKSAVAQAVVVEGFPKAQDGDNEDVISYSIGGEYASKFSVVGDNIVLVEALPEGNYPFTLVATSDEDTAELEGTLVVASSIVYVKPAVAVIEATGKAGYTSTIESAKDLLPKEVALLKEDGSATDKTVGVKYENGILADGKYTYDVVFEALEAGFAWKEGSNVLKAVVLYEDDRQVVTDIEIVNEPINVPYGTDVSNIDFSKVTATYSVDKGEAPAVEIGAWTAPEGYAEGTVVGPHVFTAAILNADNDVYKIDSSVAKEITVTVNVAKKDITVTGFDYEKAKNLSFGEEYSLPENVKVIAEGYSGYFDIDWKGVTFNPEALGETTYNGTVVVPQDGTFNFDVEEAIKDISITVTISYVIDGYEFLDEDKVPMDILYVEVGTDLAAELFEGTFPKYLVLKDGDESMEVAIDNTWWNDTGFPAAPWKTADVKLSTEEIVLEDNWSWGEFADSITFTTMTRGNAPFVVTVDGHNKNYVASLSGKSAVVKIEAIDENGIPGLANETPYMFIVDGDEANAKWQDSNTFTVEANENKKHTVVAKIRLQDGTTEYQTRYINKYSTLFNGSVYINDTVDNEKAYSAARANKNRDIKVSHDFVYSNDAEYKFTGDTKVVVYKGEELIDEYPFAAGSKSVVIPASDVKGWDDGSYRFVVTYNSNDEIVGTKTNARYVYISENGTWYNSFLINGLSRSGIVIRNNEQIKNEIELTELGDDGVVWIAHSLKTFSDNPVEVLSVPYKDVNVKKYESVISLTDENGEIRSDFANNATYKFYTTLKLDAADSPIVDMNIGRVVYIYKQVTAINTLEINDSCKSDAIIKDGVLVFKPHWFKEARKNEFNYNELTYKIKFESGLKAGASLEDAVVKAEGVEVLNGDTIVFKEAKGAQTSTVTVNADVFDEKVKAELIVEIDNVEDARLPRTFWPKAAE